MLAFAALVFVGACAPSSGWRRTGRRVCAAGDAPMVCLSAQHDGADEVRLGNATLVAGECARAPEGKGGGSVRVTVTAPDRTMDARWIRAPRARVTILEIDDGRARVQSRARCDSLPFW